MFYLLVFSLNISVVRPACQTLIQQKSKLLRRKTRQTDFSKSICCAAYSQRLPCKMYACRYADCVVPLSNNYYIKQCNLSLWQGTVCNAKDWEIPPGYEKACRPEASQEWTWSRQVAARDLKCAGEEGQFTKAGTLQPDSSRVPCGMGKGNRCTLDITQNATPAP